MVPPPDHWTLLNWGREFKGDAEFIRLLFAAGGTPFDEKSEGLEERIAAFPKGRTPIAETLHKNPTHFAPPILRNETTGFEISQTPNILEYLGEKFSLAPTSLEDKARARQIVLSACDFMSDQPVYPKFKPGTYSRQYAKAVVAIDEFVAPGLLFDRWLVHLACLVRASPAGGFLFGDQLTYADVALYHVLDAARHQFANAWRADELRRDAAAALGRMSLREETPVSDTRPRGVVVAELEVYMAKVAAHPALSAYLAGPRPPWAGDLMMWPPWAGDSMVAAHQETSEYLEAQRSPWAGDSMMY